MEMIRKVNLVDLYARKIQRLSTAIAVLADPGSALLHVAWTLLAFSGLTDIVPCSGPKSIVLCRPIPASVVLLLCFGISQPLVEPPGDRILGWCPVMASAWIAFPLEVELVPSIRAAPEPLGDTLVT
ncbi:unnamed protein product [Linum trigynum]|uniref:Uncharacterized protein n=1 Tax=Linum trigynum TaxID=586398 RepID=A0AAV2ES38_9ROSI